MPSSLVYNFKLRHFSTAMGPGGKVIHVVFASVGRCWLTVSKFVSKAPMLYGSSASNHNLINCFQVLLSIHLAPLHLGHHHHCWVPRSGNTC